MLLIFLILGNLSAWATNAVVSSEVLNIRNDHGVIDCKLYSSKDGFPSEAIKAYQHIRVRISDKKKAVCGFSNVVPGAYAISVFHDENENGKLDTNFLGIPNEGVGSSNDAKGFMGPPSFDKAMFQVGEGGVTVQIHLVYL